MWSGELWNSPMQASTADPELPGYVREKRTIDLGKANGVALLGLLPITAGYVLPFYLLWGHRYTWEGVKASLDNSLGAAYGGWALLILLGGIVVHELIHGITWAMYAKSGFRSIRFGVLWKMLTPYCHCKEPLQVRHYMIGALMPAIILGFAPAVLAMALGSAKLLAFALFFTVAAMGDFMIIQLIRKEPAGTLVLDHPSEAGCYVFRAG